MPILMPITFVDFARSTLGGLAWVSRKFAGVKALVGRLVPGWPPGGFSDDDDAGQHRRAAADPGDDVGAVAVQFQRGTGRGQGARRDGAGTVTAGSKPGGLPGGVGAAHLHGDRGEAGEAEQQRGSETRNGQRGLDRAEAVIVGA